jgi:hypothetical protein
MEGGLRRREDKLDSYVTQRGKREGGKFVPLICMISHGIRLRK